MTTSIEFKSKIHFRSGHKGQKRLRQGQGAKHVLKGRVPRIARLMALAIHIEQLIREGHIKDYAQAAELGHVSRARMSQIMNLLQLAPDIQEAILHLPLVERGRDPIDEHDVRPIAAEADWGRQRGLWISRLNGH